MLPKLILVVLATLGIAEPAQRCKTLGNELPIECGYEGANPDLCCSPPEPTHRPDMKTCGLVVKILNEPTSFHGWLYWNMQVVANGTRFVNCGGVLITKRYVLTAGHCAIGQWMNKTSSELVNVLLGNSSAPVEELVPHQYFDLENKYDDIALIRLQQDRNFTDSVKPICVPTFGELANKNYINEKLLSAGWGSSVKSKVQVSVKDPAECYSTYYNASRGSIKLKSHQILCGSAERGGDSCRSGIGSPLTAIQFYKGEARWFAVGIGSRICSGEGLPDVYTKVGLHAAWLLDSLEP